jgi:type II secretory pathway component PulF
MNEKAQSRIAAILTVASILIFVVILYLACFFPKKLSLRVQENRSLSVLEQFFAKASTFCTSFGWLLLLFLGAVLVGCGIWMIIIARRSSTGTTDNRGQ